MKPWDTDHTTTWKMYIRNLLKHPLDVNGLDIDGTVSATLSRKGENGPIEITSLEWDQLYFVLPQLGGDALLPIDWAAFSAHHREFATAVERALDLEALKQAHAASNVPWYNADDEDGGT